MPEKIEKHVLKTSLMQNHTTMMLKNHKIQIIYNFLLKSHHYYARKDPQNTDNLWFFVKINLI